MRPEHLASGDINVERSVIPATDEGVDITVAKMMEMAKGIYGMRSPKIRALAINLANGHNAADKDYFAMSEAIHNWVRDQIRYVKDPIGQETLSHPEETAFNSKAGDCDDKTILEIALLGSVGILAYPVVIGLDPRSYSHVYLHIVLPKGKYPNAGKTLAADPIMREWPLGKEAPADKVKRKKIFPHLLSGLGMLGTYASGPSYLDEENSRQVQRALDRAPGAELRDQRGDGGVQARDVEAEGLDNMFGGANAEKILARGPSTAAEASPQHKRLGTRHKTVVADGDFDARPSVSMVGEKDTEAPSNEELDVISQVIDEVAAENAPYEGTDGLLGAADPVHKAAAVAHYAGLKATRAAKNARHNPDALTAALANKAAAIANKAHAKASKATARSNKRRSALVSGLHLLNGTMGLLGDMADANPCSENPLVETRRTICGLAAALPGLAGMAGPEDERLARLGMAQGANVLFGLDGLGLDIDRQFAGMGDLDAPEGGIRRNGKRISASKTVYKGASRMLAAKRGRASAGADTENSVAQPVRRAQRARRAAPTWSPSFKARDDSLLSRPTDSPDVGDAAGSAPPSYEHGPEQMGPLETESTALSPVEEPRVVDAVVYDDSVPGTEVISTEDGQPGIEGWGTMTTTSKAGAIAGGVAVLGLLAYFLLRKKK